jgi:hypothetical protein
VALTELQRAHADKLLTGYCAKRVLPAARSQMRVGYRIAGNAVVLYEERPAFHAPHEWHAMDVAKFTHVGTRREWRLYCQHRDRRWHAYEALPAAPSLAVLLEEVDRDPTGIFWG